ncbi:MAG: DUF2975 domain-containing protein [Chitinophagaceae bacterium]|nr:MAG: DUF2975 domain-containing protein [Chitinophagaceae bacterium]
MKIKTEILLQVMHVLAWIVFIGILINAGTLLVTWGLSFNRPEAARNLYNGLNLEPARAYDFGHYSVLVLMRVVVAVFEALTAWTLLKVLADIKLASPFRIEIAKLLQRMSAFIFLGWIAAMEHNSYSTWLRTKVPTLDNPPIATNVIFIAGIVFILAQVFRKGVELQTEAELTV